MKLVSLDTVKEFLEITDETKFDTLIEGLIEGISTQIETFLNRKLKKESRTQYFPSGGKIFSLDAYPVDEAQTFTVTVWDATKDKDEDFFLDPNTGLIEFVYDTGTPRPRQVKVVYTGGYTETSGVLGVPDDLKHACKEQVAFEFRRRKDLGLASVSMPDGSVSVHQPADLLKNVQKILESYRRISL
ncbi:MAG: phage head-tail connector protein [Deltaproteobacteria bacterium]|nr:phage head-tail connector protein [Deltaproteobacteria bacterium]